MANCKMCHLDALFGLHLWYHCHGSHRHFRVRIVKFRLAKYLILIYEVKGYVWIEVKNATISPTWIPPKMEQKNK